MIYKGVEYKIGQTIKCVSLTSDLIGYKDFWSDRLVLGENYIIDDADFHFPDKVCVELKGPYYYHTEFVPIDLFHNIVEMRDVKINEILS